MRTFAVVDPGLPRRWGEGGGRGRGVVGANFQGRSANLLFGHILPENCMKMKKIWTRGLVPGTPLDPPIVRKRDLAIRSLSLGQFTPIDTSTLT